MTISLLRERNLKFGLILGGGVLVAGCAVWWGWRRGKRRAELEEGVKDPEIKEAGLKEEGNRLFKIGKYEEALSLYTRAIEAIEEGQNGGEGEVELLFQNRAAVWEKLGHPANVIKETSRALSINPKYIKARIRRGKAYKQTGFLEEALEDITCACILEKFSSPNSVQMADDLLKEIGTREAAEVLKNRKEGSVKPSKHTCSSYLRGYWNCPVSRKVREEAWEELDGSSPYALALQSLQSHTYDNIISLCTQQIELGDKLVEARYLRGTFRFLYGEGEEETMDDLKFVAKEGTKEYKACAWIKMASNYALLEKSKEAEECFGESEKVWAENVDLFHHRGQILLTRGDLPGALEEMTKAAELAPDYAIAVSTKWYVQYRMLASTGDIPGADRCIQEFQKMVRKFQSAEVYALYGQILLESQRYAEAEQQFDKVSLLDPDNAGVLVHKAMSKFHRNNNAKEAIDVLLSATKIDDRNEFILETLGTLYLQSGDLENAMTFFTRALQIARSLQEVTMLCSLKKAAEVQKNVKEKLGIQFELS